MGSRRYFNDNVLLAVVMLVAAAVRLAGLDWSLPHTYEEATPLRVAVAMWGWQDDRPTTLNPAFFNYPSLTFYLHFLVQGILFLYLKVAGAIASAGDWHFLYLTDPTTQYVAARLVGVVFGILTVLFTFRTGRAVVGSKEGVLAALLVATSPYHVVRSQMIEVDIPLTFFVALTAYALVCIVQNGRRRDYGLAGIAAGLAASSKYTGALLLVPLVVAHFIAGGAKPLSRWRSLLIALALFAAVFAITSPYVFLDWQKFRADITLERDHMKAGHFGISDTPAVKFYAQSLAERLVGWPGTLLAIVGSVVLARRHPRGAGALGVIVAVYLGVIMTWSMKADAYAMPILPLIVIFAAAAMIAVANYACGLLKYSRASRVVLAVLVLAVVADNLAGLAGRRESMQHDVRSDAQDWIEANLPAGAFIVGENYGPDLLDPAFLLQLKPDLRESVLRRWERRPIFAFVALPMFQSHPEQSATFYNLDLYPEADYVITTGPIRGRYAKNPSKFAAQAAFYQQLDLRCRKLREFGKGGMRTTVYQTTPRVQPFGRRERVVEPPALDHDTRTGRESGFYFSLATNYEYFRHLEQAASSYRLALAYGSANRQLLYSSAFGYARCLAALGRADEARAELGRLQAGIRDRQLSAAIGKLLQSMERRR